jgi:hypothetical protein
MHNAMALFRVEAMIALRTMAAQDNTNNIVVKGWPGTR